jgi:hypothetical protein
MSSNSSTMRSRNQALAHCTITRPATTASRSSCTSPQPSTTIPTSWNRQVTLATRDDRNWAGSSTVLRSAQIRSPNTHLDAQLRVEAGLGNSNGLTTMKASDRVIGISDHQPIQSRLQIETASSGRTANRVQTLTGLACRSQLSPWSPNSRASLVSVVILPACDDGAVGVLIATSLDCRTWTWPPRWPTRGG